MNAVSILAGVLAGLVASMAGAENRKMPLFQL